MEEYYLTINLEDNDDKYINLYHKEKYSYEELKEMIKNIYKKCKLNDPQIIERQMFIHYLQYYLLEEYNFKLYAKRSNYSYGKEEIF